MRTALSSLGVTSFAFALFVAPLGCSPESEDPGPSASCPDGNEIYGQCAGTPNEPLCEGDSCTDGVDCIDVKTASDKASLDSALSSAKKGACIALAPGSYGTVLLPAGVSLLGKAAAEVSVAGVTVGPGEASVLRGFEVGSEGIVISAGAFAQIDSVRVSGATVGIQVGEGAQVGFHKGSIEGGSADGMTVADGAIVTLENAIVEGNAGPGLWAACSTDCGCEAKPNVLVQTSIVRDNHVGGIVLFGANAVLSEVDISGTLVGDDVGFGLGGGGLTVAACSNLTTNTLRVFYNQSYGILIDDSMAMVGDPGADPGILVKGNKVGVWAQHISQSESQTVTLDGLTVDSNAGVGIGTTGDSVGLIICRTAVTGTVMASEPVEDGGSQQVGDGLLWLGGSEMVIDGLTLSGNARASMVIDGEATGSMKNVTLSGGDEAKGIVQQSYSNGAQPTVGANAPPIATSSTGLFAIPKAPATLPKSL